MGTMALIRSETSLSQWISKTFSARPQPVRFADSVTIENQ
jgi:hypothetical protein